MLTDRPPVKRAPVKLTLTCDFTRSSFDAAYVLKWLLKRLGRVFRVKVTDYRIGGVSDDD